MKLLLNENFPFASVRIIAQKYDAVSISLQNPGISDERVMEMATVDNRTIVTFDRDYGTLIFGKGLKPPGGVIYFRWISFHPQEPAEYLISLIEQGNYTFRQCLTVIDRESIRQRKYN